MTKSSLSSEEIGRARSTSIQSSENLDAFFRKVIDGLGISYQYAPEALKLFRAQARLENAASRNNPLATTMGGASYRLDPVKPIFNSVGVKNYATFDDGVRATIDTFINQKYAFKYAPIVNALKAGKSSVDILLDPACRDGFDTWGGSEGGRYADKVLRILSRGIVQTPPKMNIDDPSFLPFVS